MQLLPSRLSKANLAIGIFLVLGVVAAIAVTNRLSNGVRKSPTLSGPALPRQVAADPLPKEFPLDSFVPTGVPVTLSNVMARVSKNDGSKIDGPVQVRLQVSLPTGEPLQSINFVLLSFKSSGDLEWVKGWVRTLDFSSGGSTELTLDLNRRVTNGDKLVLAVERARSAATTYQTDFTELSDAVIANVRKQAAALVPVQRTAAPLPDESGAVLCNNAYRRALFLIQSSEKKNDKLGLTSLICNQQELSYTFSYGKQN